MNIAPSNIEKVEGTLSNFLRDVAGHSFSFEQRPRWLSHAYLPTWGPDYSPFSKNPDEGVPPGTYQLYLVVPEEPDHAVDHVKAIMDSVAAKGLLEKRPLQILEHELAGDVVYYHEPAPQKVYPILPLVDSVEELKAGLQELVPAYRLVHEHQENLARVVSEAVGRKATSTIGHIAIRGLPTVVNGSNGATTRGFSPEAHEVYAQLEGLQARGVIGDLQPWTCPDKGDGVALFRSPNHAILMDLAAAHAAQPSRSDHRVAPAVLSAPGGASGGGQ